MNGGAHGLAHREAGRDFSRHSRLSPAINCAGKCELVHRPACLLDNLQLSSASRAHTNRMSTPSTTRNFVASKIAIDLFRNVFSLSFETIELDQPAGSTPVNQYDSGITEPSVAQWIPSTPNP